MSMNKTRLDYSSFNNGNKNKIKIKSSKSGATASTLATGSTTLLVNGNHNDTNKTNSLMSSVENITGISSKPNLSSMSSARIPIHFQSSSSLANGLSCTNNNYRIGSANNSTNTSTYNGVTNKPSRFVRHHSGNNSTSNASRAIRTQSLISAAKLSKTLSEVAAKPSKCIIIKRNNKQTLIKTKNSNNESNSEFDNCEQYEIEMISRSTSPTQTSFEKITDANANKVKNDNIENIHENGDRRSVYSDDSNNSNNDVCNGNDAVDEQEVHPSRCSICNVERMLIVRPKKHIFGIQKCHQAIQTNMNGSDDFDFNSSANDMSSSSFSNKEFINTIRDGIRSRPIGNRQQSTSSLSINKNNNNQNRYAHVTCNTNSYRTTKNRFTSAPVIPVRSTSTLSNRFNSNNDSTHYNKIKFGTSSTAQSSSSSSSSLSSSSSSLMNGNRKNENSLKNGQQQLICKDTVQSSSMIAINRRDNNNISIKFNNNNYENINRKQESSSSTTLSTSSLSSMANDKQKISPFEIDCVDSSLNHLKQQQQQQSTLIKSSSIHQQQQYSGSVDNINLLTVINLDNNKNINNDDYNNNNLILGRSASAEPLSFSNSNGNRSSPLSRSSSSSASTSSSLMSYIDNCDNNDEKIVDQINMNNIKSSSSNSTINSENGNDMYEDALENNNDGDDDNVDDDDDDNNNTFTIRLSSAQSNRTVISCDSFIDDDHDDNNDNDDSNSNNNNNNNDLNGKNDNNLNDEKNDEIEIENAIISIENEVTSLKLSSNSLIFSNNNNIHQNCNNSNRNLIDPLNNIKSSSKMINNDDDNNNNEMIGNNDNSDSNNNNQNQNDQNKELNDFISKYKDIDEMIGPITSTMIPTSPNYSALHALRKFKFENVREKFEHHHQQSQQDNNKTVSIDASHVRVHCPNKPLHSTVEFLTEEIDSSVVRIRENQPLSGHLSKINDDNNENYIVTNNCNNNISIKNQQSTLNDTNDNFVQKKFIHPFSMNSNHQNQQQQQKQSSLLSSTTPSSTSSLEDCTFQLYKYNDETNECEYGNYIDLDMNIDEQSEEFDGFLSNRKNAIILRTKLSVRVHAIIEKLLNSSGKDLRRALFSLKQIFQDDKDLVHEFVRNDGLACLIKVGSEADQNYQNYILRALGQLMLYVDGMNGVIEHPETIQWLYSLISSEYRLVVKTALKLLLVFVEYIDSNCLILINSIHQIDNEKGVKPWNNIMNILNEKDSADIELLIFSMTLINKTLNGIPDQDTYYDVCDALEEQGIERIIQHYMSKHGTDRDLLQQFRIYEAVLRLEDGDDDGYNNYIPADSKIIPRNRKINNNNNDNSNNCNEDRRKSKRHSLDNVKQSFPIKNKQNNAASQFSRLNNKSCLSSSSTAASITTTTTTTTASNNSSFNNKKTFYNLPPNVNPSLVSNGFDEININVKKRDFRSKNMTRDLEIHNQRCSISSCSSADSYGSYASYGSYVSNDDTKATTLIDPLKNLDSPSIDSTEDDTDRSLDLNSRSSNHTESSEEMLKLHDFESSQESFNLWETTRKTVINHGFHQPNGDVSTGLSRQPSLKERKTWMLSLMYGKTNGDDAPKSPNFVKPPAPIPPSSTGLWNGNAKMDIVSPSPTVINDLLNLNKPTESVKCLKEKFIQQTTQSDANCVPKMIHPKEQIADKFTNNFEYLQWEQLVNQMSRPLVINDMDFTDLVDDDDNDICNPTTNVITNGNNNCSNNFGPPPPPPPPMLPMNGSTPPPPPPPRFNGPGLGNWSSNNNNNNNGFGTTTPSPPLPPLDLRSPNNSNSNKNKKTIKLFWKEVKEDKSLLSRIMKKKTIWDEIKHIPVDTEKLETLFESRTKELMNKKAQDANKKNEILVLDTKRSNAINIGMTKLPPPRTIKTAILKMDQSIMNREGIDKILSTMMPTEEEKNKIMEAEMANPDVPLGQAESFLMTLSSITALEARLRLWAFRLDYEQMEREVAEPLMDLKQAINELEKSETFKIILGTLRSIGSFLNGSEVKGFQIDYLAKVPEIKDTIHKHSLLHHLAQMIMEKYPNTSNLYSELGAVSRASKVDFDDLGKNLHKMEQDCKQSWEHLKVISKFDGSSPMKNKMSEFLADCAQRIIVLEIIHRRVMNRFKKFLVFLGMPSSAIKDNKPNHLLKIISEFALEYRTTRERVREQIEKKHNHRERNKTRGKMITEMDKFKSKEKAETDLERILTGSNAVNGDMDNRLENGNIVTKWGTLPGTKLRRPSTGSMTNLLMNGNSPGVNTPNAANNDTRSMHSYRHSVHIETYGEADDEILESLVRSTTQQPVRTPEKNRRKARYGDRKSLRRTLKGNLDLSEEERMMLAAIKT